MTVSRVALHQHQPHCSSTRTVQGGGWKVAQQTIEHQPKVRWLTVSRSSGVHCTLALHQSYLATAYTCSPGSKGCTTGKTGHMAKLNANKTQIQTVIKFDANSDSATIGGTFSKDMPETAGGGVNYCYWGGLREGNVIAGPNAAACQAGVNALVAEFGLPDPPERFPGHLDIVHACGWRSGDDLQQCMVQD